MNKEKEVLYNVHCVDCGSFFQPLPKSSLWWQARKREAEGLLGALYIKGEECGCIKEVNQPDAPYRVFGYDDMCRNFDFPFTTFTKAVSTFLELNRDGMYVVFIEGVSKAVEKKLQYL